MASTEAVREHPLRLEHLPGCLRLSRSANWNQNEADWRWMLEFGRGYGRTLADGTLAASTIALPYGARFAWISMVLVLPEHRRRGFATRLLRHALDDLQAEARAAVLDATPAGREVYRQEGFRECWGFKRYSLERLARTSGGIKGVRALEPADWQRISMLDTQAFGADRVQLLRTLAARLPPAALVCERSGELCGYLVGRDGREASQLGPLVARDPGSARALLQAALEQVRPPVYLDVVDRAPALIGWLEQSGFSFQRPFTRMVHGADRAPGDVALVFCPAGAELG